MTNRIDYTIPTIPQTRQADIEAIAKILIKANLPLTLDNATAVLTRGLSNKPDGWLIGFDDLPALWVEFVEKPGQLF